MIDDKILRAHKLRLAGIVDESVVDGNGFRMTVFVQGCPHRCEGCHNMSSWDFDGGETVTLDYIADAVKKNPLLDGVTLSGGEPFEQAESAAVLAAWLHENGYNVWTYTGYTLEQLLRQGGDKLKLLKQTDVLVDGPFVLARRNLMLRFRGSDNQRLIDMNKTRAADYKQTVLWDNQQTVD